jgi:hypothetical protein
VREAATLAVKGSEDELLGALMSGAGLAEVAKLVDASDFTTEANRRIYEAVERLTTKGVAASATTVGAELEDAGQLALIGGHFRLHTLVENVPTSKTAPYHAQRVREAATKRRMARIAGEHQRAVQAAISDPLRSPAEVAEELSASARDLTAELATVEAVDADADNILSLHINRVPVVSVRKSFPLHVFPPNLREWIDQASAALHITPDHMAIYVLGYLSAAIGNSRRLQVKNKWVEPFILWLAVVLPPGSTKTAAMSLAGAPLAKYEAELYQKYTTRLDAYNVAFGQWSAEGKKGIEPKRPVPHRVLVQDVTIEALAVILRNNPNGVCLEGDEGTAWVRGQNEYKGGQGADRSKWLQSWNATPFTVDRKTEQIRVEHPWVTVTVNVQPDMLPEFSEAKGRSDGWMERMLFAMPPVQPNLWSDAEIDKHLDDDYTRLMRRLLALELEPDNHGRLAPRNIRPTREAMEVFKAENDQVAKLRMDPTTDDSMAGVYAKAPSYAARLAGILGVTFYHSDQSETGESPDADRMHGAWELVDYFIAHAHAARDLMHTSPNDRRAEQTHQIIQERLGGACTARTLLNSVSWIKKADDAKLLMESIANRGFGRLVKDQRPGPGEAVRLVLYATASTEGAN